MTKQDLARVLEWRNHKNIRRFMYTQHEISLNEHLKWFTSASKDDTRHPLMYEEKNTPIGFINFTKSKNSLTANWGFYLAPDAAKGTGYQLGVTALNYAFSTLRLEKVRGESIEFNERSIQFHLNLGFKKEGVLENQFFDGEFHHDVFCFGLSVSDWNTRNREIYEQNTTPNHD